MAPQAWSRSGLKISVRAEAVGEQIIGKFASLLEAVDSFGDLEVDPFIIDVGIQIVFINEFAWDVSEFDPDVLRAVKRCSKVEVLDVEAGKLGTWAGGDAVDEELDNL